MTKKKKRQLEADGWIRASVFRDISFPNKPLSQNLPFYLFRLNEIIPTPVSAYLLTFPPFCYFIPLFNATSLHVSQCHDSFSTQTIFNSYLFLPPSLLPFFYSFTSSFLLTTTFLCIAALYPLILRPALVHPAPVLFLSLLSLKNSLHPLLRPTTFCNALPHLASPPSPPHHISSSAQ